MLYFILSGLNCSDRSIGKFVLPVLKVSYRETEKITACFDLSRVAFDASINDFNWKAAITQPSQETERKISYLPMYSDRHT